MSRRHPLDPKLDLVFKTLFAKPQNVKLLISFLNATLSLDARIESLEVLNPELPKQGLADKGVVLDFRVRLANQDYIDVEMQAQVRPGRRERALYYWARMFAGQLVRGEQYGALRRCVVVFIFDFIEVLGDDLHTVFSIRDERRNEKLSDHFQLRFIELPKLMRSQTHENERLLRAWCKFLTASTEAELEELTMVDPIFQQAKVALEELSADPEVRRQAEDREAAILLHDALYRADLEQAAERARFEGRAEGRAGGRTELLLEQLHRKFGTLSEPVRERVRNASPDLISLWAERILFASSLDELFRATPP